MAPVVPSSEPEQLAVGETVRWTKTLGDYPPSEGWTLKYALRGASALDVTATVVGSEYSVTIPSSGTGGSNTIEPGMYTLAGYVEGSGAFAGQRYQVHRSVVRVTPDVGAAQPGELQSKAERNLAAIDAVIEGRITSDVESYTIAGRQVTKIPIGDLMKLRSRFAAQVRRQRNPGRFGRAVGVQFGRASS